MLKNLLGALAVTVAFHTNVEAAILTLGANLTPGAELHGPDVTGFSPKGTALTVLDTDTGDFAWLVTFNGLTTPTFAAFPAHFHGPADEHGVANPPNHPPHLDIGNEMSPFNQPEEMVQISVNGTGLTAGAFAGTAILDMTQIDEVLAGLWYINIHTVQNNFGELRGQLLPVSGVTTVPLPAALWLMVPAIGMLGARRRG